MAKTIVQYDEDPGIAIILYVDDEDGAWNAEACTQCGYQCRSRADLEDIQQEAEIHIDCHESAL